MSLRALMHTALAASLLLFALAAGAAEVIRFGYLELNKDARYDERKAFFRTLSRPFGPPYAGAEVALREARFVGQALGVSFDLVRACGADAPALVAELDKLHAEGVRYFLIDAPGKVVAEVAAATRGRALLLFNVSAPDDALRQAQCQAHLYHTLPNHGMQTDAIAQFLVFKKWRNVLLLQGPLDDDKLIGAAFENSARRLGLKIVAKKDFVLSNDPRQRELGNVGSADRGRRLRRGVRRRQRRRVRAQRALRHRASAPGGRAPRAWSPKPGTGPGRATARRSSPAASRSRPSATWAAPTGRRGSR